MIKAVVTKNLRESHMISVFADRHLVAVTWGPAKVKYTLGIGQCSKYMMDVNHCESFLHMDAIERDRK